MNCGINKRKFFVNQNYWFYEEDNMIGAIIGDIVGSRFEGLNSKPDKFELFTNQCCFTDDTVLSIAISKALLEISKEKTSVDTTKYYQTYLQQFGRKYPDRGYGPTCDDWLKSKDPKPYNSYGNGSAMRVAPIGYAFDTLSETLDEAKKSACVTHNHSDGIKGAKAVAGAVYLGRKKHSKEQIKNFIENEIGYSLNFNIESLHLNYKYEIQCEYSVPQAIFCFLVSNNFEDAIRKAIYIGGDTDTVACIAGAISEAFYKRIPNEIKQKANAYLDEDLRKIIKEFSAKFRVKN
jgi:ADP-ribosylglycohydrolase